MEQLRHKQITSLMNGSLKQILLGDTIDYSMIFTGPLGEMELAVQQTGTPCKPRERAVNVARRSPTANFEPSCFMVRHGFVIGVSRNGPRNGLGLKLLEKEQFARSTRAKDSNSTKAFRFSPTKPCLTTSYCIS